MNIFKFQLPPPLVDLIHYPYYDLFFHTLPLRSKTYRVVTIHDVIPLVFSKHYPTGIKGKINLKLQKIALNNVNAIICDSLTSKRDIANKLSINNKKIYVIYLAPGKKFKIIDIIMQRKVTQKYKLPNSFALYVGDVNWSKNIPNLLLAIKKSDNNLVMVGKALVNDNLRETKEINKIINDLNLKNKVIKTGYINENDLVAIYNSAFVTLLPSFYEGFGLTLLESMACGTPVICSSNSSLNEIGKNIAIFCDPHNADDIANKIDNILKIKDAKKEDLSHKLINHASQYTWSKVASDTIDVYEQIMNNTKI